MKGQKFSGFWAPCAAWRTHFQGSIACRPLVMLCHIETSMKVSAEEGEKPLFSRRIRSAHGHKQMAEVVLPAIWARLSQNSSFEGAGR